MKISEALSKFLLGRRADGIAPSTVEWYRKRLTRFVEFFNDCELSAITIDDLRRFVVSLQEQNVKWARHKYHKPVKGSLSVSTIHGYVRNIKAFYNWLEQNDDITPAQNVAVRLKKPKLPKQPPKEIAENDLVALLKASQNYGRYAKRNYAMICFLADTGCRLGGLVGLQRTDLDLQKGQALVVEKGSKARVVFFGRETKDALTVWLAESSKSAEFVFVCERGRMTPDNVRLLFKRLASRAGVSGRSNPHSFRHAFAKRHLVCGGDLASLADLMGHSDITVTKNSYSIFITEELRRKHQQYSTLDSILPK